MDCYFIIQLTSFKTGGKNFLTFCCSTPLIPLALLFSKVLRIPFQYKENPLSNLGFILSLTQMPYLLIAMWAFSCSSENMLMIYAMIFGAHLLPFGWLYRSKIYYIMSIFVPLVSLIVGLYCPNYILAIVMIGIEVLFSIILLIEVKLMNMSTKDANENV